MGYLLLPEYGIFNAVITFSTPLVLLHHGGAIKRQQCNAKPRQQKNKNKRETFHFYMSLILKAKNKISIKAWVQVLVLKFCVRVPLNSGNFTVMKKMPCH